VICKEVVGCPVFDVLAGDSSTNCVNGQGRRNFVCIPMREFLEVLRNDCNLKNERSNEKSYLDFKKIEEHRVIHLILCTCFCVIPPATCAAAMEVPERRAVSVLLRIQALVIWCPGANRSVQGP